MSNSHVFVYLVRGVRGIIQATVVKKNKCYASLSDDLFLSHIPQDQIWNEVMTLVCTLRTYFTNIKTVGSKYIFVLPISM